MKRGPTFGEPTTDQLRALYDGTTDAEAVNATMSGLAIVAPKPVAAPAAAASRADRMMAAAEALAALMASQTQPIDADAVRAIARGEVMDAGKIIADQAALQLLDALPALVEEQVAKHVRTIEVRVADHAPVKIDQAHAALPVILQVVAAGVTPMLVGPAGSGKTMLAHQIATALGRPFHMAARVESAFELTGYRDAGGVYHRSAFREAYEHGGVFLFDEIDASDPNAMTAFNAALANGHTPFPDGLIARHPDFAAIAAANTFGRGADREYVGRNQLDAATLDRFATFEVDYDEALERALAGNDDWTRRVQSIRAAIRKEKVRHIVSPRASITGAKLLAAGMDRKAVEEAVVWKGLDESNRARVNAAVRGA